MAGLLGGGGLRGHGELPLNADINVTSLVDVAFVLLIIFMITAPMMQGGVPLELPKAEGRPLAPGEGVIVSVDRRGQIWVDQTRVSYAEFRAAFRAVVARKRTSVVIVRGDRGARYGDVVRVFAAIQASGLNLKVNVITEDEEVSR
jgi:biopolymer transport protein ExbD/biopolymer transport protein TolR